MYFPINEAKTKFLYVIRNESGKLDLHIRTIYNQTGDYSNNNYNATEEILNLKTYEIYTQKFENNNLVKIKAPFSIAAPYWESCMLENGVFEIDGDGKINANEEKLKTLGYPPCGWQGTGGSENIFKKFGNWLKRVFSSTSEVGDYTGGNSGGSVFPPEGSGSTGGWIPPGESGSGSGGGSSSIYGNDPRFNQPLTAPGFDHNGNRENGIWTEIALNNTNDPILVNQYADVNGYINTRKTALKIYLQNKPYGAIDCNDINNLPMQHFQNLATYVPPSSVLQRIQYIINTNSPAYTTNNTFVQKITDGVGVVNMDFFAVRIIEFPLKTNGQHMTPLEFLDFFRKNKSNAALPAANGSTFSPFQHYAAGSININETTLFNTDFASSLGAWVHIDIPVPNPIDFPMSNDGTVVLSDYHIDNTAQHYWYTFTTMATMYDGTHPVCGNRRFGIAPHPQGGWQFYITGVDRVWDYAVHYFGLAPLGFANADILWQSLQNSIINHCNNNGGQAQHFIQPSLKARVSWDKVEQFLTGQISLQQLKDQLQCP